MVIFTMVWWNNTPQTYGMVFPKYKLVSSHTCRRTFATINVLRGFHEAEIRRATGHKTSEAFSKYLWYFDD